MGYKNCVRGSRERAEEVSLCWGNVDFTLRPKLKDLSRERESAVVSIFQKPHFDAPCKEEVGHGQDCSGEPHTRAQGLEHFMNRR